LLIYFFPRSISLLAEDGIGMLIVQNGWLNTEYGAKASQFLTKTLQQICQGTNLCQSVDENTICGETMGNYHPHGDVVIYPSLIFRV